MPRTPALRGLLALVAAAVLAAGCTSEGGGDSADRSATPSTSAPSPSTSGSTPSPSAPASAAPGTVPPAWLGTRVLPVGPDGYGAVRPTPRELRHRRFTLPDPVAALPGRGFASRVVAPAPARVLARSTWGPRCPVAADDLAWVRVAFRGFDGARHTGELLVNRTAADDLVGVFRDLWRARFPFERIAVTTRAELDAAPTGDGNDTGAFVCRPITGGTSYSEHAYGLAIDINPFQNPYVRGDLVLPELASAYADRAWVRPGMITPDGPVVRAFARIGWAWGGAWSTRKDYQHFSASGR
ncbi:M15 family metallopeptidase [Nocardioides pantholopis]|uniref:M15 family metallopeptidase n=1 Tax=Nocardioides pantholopis TaxID=2483798 RepID=UPI000FDBAD0A|nr:M15 family metallopeptidase [Nocardioides pantholopis]